MFGANYIKGKVRAQPNGNFVGEVKFKLYFKSGGAIEYGMALLRAAKTAQSNYHNSGGGYDDRSKYKNIIPKYLEVFLIKYKYLLVCNELITKVNSYKILVIY